MKHRPEDFLFLDFETFYSTSYSLSAKAYNTSGYVRDRQFLVHCLGIKDGLAGPAFWIPASKVPQTLKRLRAGKRPIVCHNTAFDGLILADRYDIVPPFYYDTLSMSRALHGPNIRHDLGALMHLYRIGVKNKANLVKVKGLRKLTPEQLAALGDYCVGDVEGMAKLFKVFLSRLPESTLRLIDWTIRAFCDSPLRIDRKLAKEEYDAELARKAEKIELAKTEMEILQSAEQLAQALEALGVDPPTKVSLRTGEETYAFAKTDAAFRALLDHENPQVVRLVEARLAAKSTIGETRARRFMDVGKNFPVGYNFCGAHTTRWSGANKLNAQNLNRPQYDKQKKLIPGTGRLRRSIMAPPGHVLVVRDSGQIECRTNAWFSDEHWLVESFRAYDRKQGLDPYRIMAGWLFSEEPEKIDSNQRFIGKVCELGLGYNMGGPKLKVTLALGLMGPPVVVDEMEATRMVTTYRNKHTGIVQNWQRCERILFDLLTHSEGKYKCIEWGDETIWLPNGLGMHYWDLKAYYDEVGGKYVDYHYQSRTGRTHIYGGKTAENIIQALSCVIIGEQLLEINDSFRVVMTTHDELVAVAPKRKADECMELMDKVMCKPPAWAPDLPLVSEGSYDVRYSK